MKHIFGIYKYTVRFRRLSVVLIYAEVDSTRHSLIWLDILYIILNQISKQEAQGTLSRSPEKHV